MKLLEGELNKLQTSWGWSDKETNDVRLAMANFALAAVHDSIVAEEATAVFVRLADQKEAE